MKKPLLVLCAVSMIMVTACAETRQPIEQSKPKAKSVTDISTSAVSAQSLKTVKPEVTAEPNEIIQLSSDNEEEAENNLTQKEEKHFYNKVKRLYLSGKWDGKIMNIKSHNFSLDETYGYLLIDGYYSIELQCLDLEGVEINKKTADSNDWEYIPGKGAYLLQNHMLTRYVRGKKIPLEGEKLEWKGMDLDLYGTAAQAFFKYDKKHDKLFLISSIPPKDGKSPYNYVPWDEKSWYPGYLYIFPDYNVSKMEYIGKIDEGFCDEDGFYYTDVSGKKWRYCEKGSKFYFKEK